MTQPLMRQFLKKDLPITKTSESLLRLLFNLFYYIFFGTQLPGFSGIFPFFLERISQDKVRYGEPEEATCLWRPFGVDAINLFGALTSVMEKVIYVRLIFSMMKLEQATGSHLLAIEQCLVIVIIAAFAPVSFHTSCTRSNVTSVLFVVYLSSIIVSVVATRADFLRE